MKKEKRKVKLRFPVTDIFKILLYVALGVIAILVVWGIIKAIMWFSQHIFITILLSPVLIGVVIGIISGLCSDGDCDSYSYSDYSSTESETKYENQDIFGVPHGSSTVNSNKATHSNFWGVWEGDSEINGDKIQHKTWYGTYNGVSEIKDGGKKIEHYGDIDEGYVYKGYSKINDNGDIDHYDVFGVYTGTSKKK